MNKTASCHPAIILVLWAKFLPVCLFRPVRLFIYCQNSTMYAYSGSTLIRETRVWDKIRHFWLLWGVWLVFTGSTGATGASMTKAWKSNMATKVIDSKQWLIVTQLKHWYNLPLQKNFRSKAALKVKCTAGATVGATPKKSKQL